MGVSEGNVVGTTALLLLSAVFAFTGAVHFHIHNSYMMDVTVKGTEIEFKVAAKGVKGWIGIGINTVPVMNGSDLFIGGYDPSAAANNREYGKDYHGVAHAAVLDTISQDWTLVNATEKDDTTTITVKRPLVLRDKVQDKDIKNETMYFLWSFNNNNDNTSARHSERNFCAVNLLSGETGNCSISDSGASSIVSIGLSTLLMGLVAAVLKN